MPRQRAFQVHSPFFWPVRHRREPIMNKNQAVSVFWPRSEPLIVSARASARCEHQSFTGAGSRTCFLSVLESIVGRCGQLPSSDRSPGCKIAQRWCEWVFGKAPLITPRFTTCSVHASHALLDLLTFCCRLEVSRSDIGCLSSWGSAAGPNCWGRLLMRAECAQDFTHSSSLWRMCL